MFKKYIRLNILIVKCFFVLLLLSSCDFFDYSVTDKEIIKSSSWNSNDQPPSYPECESLELTEQNKCFIESIEKKLTTYFNDRKINLEISEYVVKVSIDTLGNFSVVNITSEDSPSNETKKYINEALSITHVGIEPNFPFSAIFLNTLIKLLSLYVIAFHLCNFLYDSYPKPFMIVHKEELGNNGFTGTPHLVGSVDLLSSFP